MTDAELVEAAALERQVSELTRKNCELEEKLDEYENAYKFIMDDKCFNEEKHCACAPILRAKVKELEAENTMLKAMKLLTVKDVAEMLQISTRTVYDHTHRTKFTPRSHTQKVRKISAS